MSLCLQWEHSLEVIGLYWTSEIDLQWHESAYDIVLLCFLCSHSSVPTHQEVPENLSMSTVLKDDFCSWCVGHRWLFLQSTLWVLPTPFQPYWGPANFNNSGEKLKFNPATQIYLHRVMEGLVQLGRISLGRERLENLSSAVMRAKESETLNTYSQNLTADWGSLELGKGTLCPIEGRFVLRWPDNWGLQEKCCQKTCLSSARPNVGIWFRENGTMA